jgi:glycosyltransferase involved in cell wall biosynthesis
VSEARLSVVIPAYNAERTLERVLAAVREGADARDELIVVDDGSTDRTAEIARAAGATILEGDGQGYAGGARNLGWEHATGDVVVFLDADDIPMPGWSAGVRRAVREFPGAIIGGGRAFAGTSGWSWVAHLQVETPYLAVGEPRPVPFVASYCMIVPRELALRFDRSYGGEDAVFCIDARAAQVPMVFDPRFATFHDHQRRSFTALRAQQHRLAYGLARCGPEQLEGLQKRVLSRLPMHYFLLVRLPIIWRRVRGVPTLRGPFLRHLPQLVVAEWSLGVYALRYVVRRPSLRGQDGAGFR